MSFWRDIKTFNLCKYEQTATKSKMMINISFDIWQKKSSDNTERSEPQAASIVTYTEEENDMEAKNTKKSTATVACAAAGLFVSNSGFNRLHISARYLVSNSAESHGNIL